MLFFQTLLIGLQSSMMQPDSKTIQILLQNI